MYKRQMYSSMTEQDLGAIYDYLRSLPPVDSRIEKWTAAVAQAQ